MSALDADERARFEAALRGVVSTPAIGQPFKHARAAGGPVHAVLKHLSDHGPSTIRDISDVGIFDTYELSSAAQTLLANGRVRRVGREPGGPGPGRFIWDITGLGRRSLGPMEAKAAKDNPPPAPAGPPPYVPTWKLRQQEGGDLCLRCIAVAPAPGKAVCRRCIDEPPWVRKARRFSHVGAGGAIRGGDGALRLA